MIDEHFDGLARELRAAAPTAPDHVRERVAAIAARPAPPARRIRMRWALAPAAAAAVATAVVIGVVSEGGGSPQQLATPSVERVTNEAADGGLAAGSQAPITPARRAQLYSAEIMLRVRSLSNVTQNALRETRALGGYVRRVDYGEGSGEGTARLVIRVPIAHVQTAILRFSELGKILDQQVSLRDIQPRLDRRLERIVELRQAIPTLAGDELAAAQAQLERLERSQANDRRRAGFATVSLNLTTREETVVPTPPGRIERAFQRAADVLAAEVVAVVYAGVVAAPFLLIAAVLVASARMARRRSDARLLG